MNLACILLTRQDKVDKKIIDGLNFASEIIILHDSKTDLKINSESKKIKHIYHPLGSDFAKHRNYALSKSNSEWTLFLDEDECISKELVKEIESIDSNTKYSGFLIPRRDVVFYDEVKHGEVGNAKILRLARTKSGSFERDVHEVWKVTGKIGILNSFIYHFKDFFVSEFLSRIIMYSKIDSKSLSLEGKQYSLFKLLAYPNAKFIQNYFIKLGFLDGYVGLFYAYLLSVQSLSNRVFQWEQKQKLNT